MYILKISNHSKKLFFIFLFAFFIRFVAFSQSFWLDEAVTAHVVKYNTFFKIVKNFSPHDFHPPLYYLFLKIWSIFFGFSEMALRLPSLLFSIATGLVIYHIGRSIKSNSFGLWSAVFFLFNPLIVYYSQEARMYMMAAFFITASFYFLLKNKMGLFTLFSVLSFYTFYGSLFFFIVSALYLWYKRKFRFSLYFIFHFLFFSSLLFSIANG